MGNIKIKRTIILVVAYLILFTSLFAFLFPIVWQVLTSFMSDVQSYSYPPTFIPNPFQLKHYITTWSKADVPIYFINSLIAGLGSTALALFAGSLAGYALARLRVKGSGAIAFIILMTRMMPPIAIIFPLYLLFTYLNWMDTRYGVILAHTTFSLPFAVWMMRGYFMEVPMEIEESAMVDGASRLKAMTSIVIPLVKPGFVATAIFTLILSWNDLLFALVLTRDKAATMPILLAGLAAQTEYGEMMGALMAVGTLIILPVIIFAFLIQKHLIRGLTWGAVKG